MKKKKYATFGIWVGLILIFMLLFVLDRSDSKRGYETFETFKDQIEAGTISSVHIHNNEIHVEKNDGGPAYITLGVVDDELTQQLSDMGAHVAWGEPARPFRKLLVVGIPLLILLLFLVFFVKKASSAHHGGVFAVGKTTAREVTDSKVTFADIGGCQEAKAQLGDVVDFLKNPVKWTSSGARLPRGILLEGPPGCGKTLLAQAVAGETDASFFSLSASEFVEMFVGVGAARVRDLFQNAAKNTPSVIFIDELDAVGRRRGSGIGWGHDEREQTLNQLLVNLDGFEKEDRVVVIAATNRSDVLDPALMRPGRFDRRISIPALSQEARHNVLEIHTRDKCLGTDVSLEKIAELTSDYTGAQLESLVNEATLLAVRKTTESDVQATVTMPDFCAAIESVTNQDMSFNSAETLLVESATQVARPNGVANVTILLEDGDSLSGDLIWADAAFMKLRDSATSREIVVPKQRIQQISCSQIGKPVPAVEFATDEWTNVASPMV